MAGRCQAKEEVLMRGEVMPSLIRPGGDLVEATNAQLEFASAI